MSARTIEDWRVAVYRSRSITDNTRVYLLLVSDHAKQATGRITASEPRQYLASRLGVSERRIDERVKAAKEAGYLDTISAGRKGSTAVYQLTFPDSDSATPVRRAKSGDSATPTSALFDRITAPPVALWTRIARPPWVAPVVPEPRSSSRPTREHRWMTPHG